MLFCLDYYDEFIICHIVFGSQTIIRLQNMCNNNYYKNISQNKQVKTDEICILIKRTPFSKLTIN